jgi:hypothetical protein
LIDFAAYTGDKDFARYRYFFVHSPAYLVQVLPKPLFTFSWLRDPVDRSISAYNHILRSPNHPTHKLMISETSDFESFVQHPQLRQHVAEVITVHFGSDVNLVGFEGRTWQAAVASRGAVSTPPDKHTLARAKERLLEFDFIGFYDRMEQDCQTLTEILGLRFTGPVPHVNADAASETIRPRARRTAEIEELMAKHSPLDIELYQFARERLGADVPSQILQAGQ